jgi:site-specific recombinase XerD
MNNTLIPSPAHNIERLAPVLESAAAYVQQAKAPATLRAYRVDWNAFTAWCEAAGLAALPATPSTVALFVAAEADTGRKVATIGRRLAAIAKAHQAAGFDSPASLKHAAVAEVWHGVRRVKGVAQTAKAPAVVDTLRAMVGQLPDSLLGVRDRALLLLGFAGAFRRSELVGLTVEDVAIQRDGLVVTLRRSKTDQEGQGRKVGIPFGSRPETCPVRAVQAWLEAAHPAGLLFCSINRHGQAGAALTAQSVALVVKRYAAAAGLDAAQFAGHSLRAGLATAAAVAGVSERAIMAQTGHRSAAMVRRYIRDGNLFRENAAAGVGL